MLLSGCFESKAADSAVLEGSPIQGVETPPPPPPLQRPDPDISISFQEAVPKTLIYISAKDTYKNLLKQDYQINAAYNKWLAGEDGISIDSEQEWSGVCSRAFSASRETKLQSLQYKINNRIVPCGVHLKQIRIRDTHECPTCKEKDTLIHFFFHCPGVVLFCRQICRWFKGSVNLYLDRISPKEFLFGVKKECHRSKVINHVLLHTRFYIFRQKLFHNCDLHLVQWLQEYKTALRMERWICVGTGQTAKFDRWKGILEELG